MPTRAASRFDHLSLQSFHGVASRAELRQLGITVHQIAAQVAARRWQAVGSSAVLLHSGKPDTAQRRRIVVLNCGRRSVLTSFTALEEFGLRGWERPEIHVLVPPGTRGFGAADVVVHRCATWSEDDLLVLRRLHRLGPALVVAAASCRSARPACGLFAAAVQQRLASVSALRDAVMQAPRARHRAAVLLALDDIDQGAHALSEIDFARLCRRAGLPAPARQAVRREPSGRRRYLDVEWHRADGSARAVEVDGALDLGVRRWWDDHLRQNEVVITGTPVLRFPSVVVRTEEAIVVDQLRRFLQR